MEYKKGFKHRDRGEFTIEGAKVNGKYKESHVHNPSKFKMFTTDSLA